MGLAQRPRRNAKARSDEEETAIQSAEPAHGKQGLNCILGEDDRVAPPSPAATASLAIGEEIAAQILKSFSV